MPYPPGSTERGVLENDPVALGRVIRWISGTLTWRRFWGLRTEWPDLQQEALLRVIESLRQDRFDPRRDFERYVKAVARYTALGAWQRRGRQERNPIGAARDAGSEPMESILTRKQMVRWALDASTDECRDLIRTYFLEEGDYESIAKEKAVPVGTVKSRLARCLKRLRDVLGGYERGSYPMSASSP